MSNVIELTFPLLTVKDTFTRRRVSRMILSAPIEPLDVAEREGELVALWARQHEAAITAWALEVGARVKTVAAPTVIDDVNREYFAVDIAGKVRVGYVRHRQDSRGQLVRDLHLASKESFFDLLIHPRVRVGHGDTAKLIDRGKYWFASNKRREYRGVVYAPGSSTPGYYNLWQGYAVTPRPGCWERMQLHILDVICAGNVEHAQYVISWLAWSVQNPGKPAGTALVLRGAEGTGKGTLAEAMLRIFGQHGRHEQSMDALTGHFNAHLAECSFLFADEAVAGADADSQGVLFGLITEPRIAIERKGYDRVSQDNCLHIMMASNHEWVVPSGNTGRRFVVLDVAATQACNLEYFAALRAEMENGGIEAMLYDLLALDLGSWTPMTAAPKTAALAEQQTQGLRGAKRQIYNMLSSGLALGSVAVKGDRVFISTTKLKEATGLSKKNHEDSALIVELKSLGGIAGHVRVPRDEYHTDRFRGFWLPSLRECRRRWTEARSLQHLVWPDTSTEWMTDVASPSETQQDTEEKNMRAF